MIQPRLGCIRDCDALWVWAALQTAELLVFLFFSAQLRYVCLLYVPRGLDLDTQDGSSALLPFAVGGQGQPPGTGRKWVVQPVPCHSCAPYSNTQASRQSNPFYFIRLGEIAVLWLYKLSLKCFAFGAVSFFTVFLFLVHNAVQYHTANTRYISQFF